MTTPDYTLNREAVGALAENIQQYWHDRGQTEVSVWVKPVPVYHRQTGKKLTTRYEINSNIIQNVSSLEKENIL